MSNSNWSFSQEFSTQFQTLRSGLESRIESAASAPPVSAEALQTFSADLAKITKTLVDATGSLPAYDQRQSQLQLDALEKRLDGLRSASAPTPKFSFKRKVNKTPVPVSNPSESEAGVLPVVANPQGVASVATATTNLALSSRAHCYITSDSLPDIPPSSDLTISELDYCIVNLLSPSVYNLLKGEQPEDDKVTNLSALHIRNVRNSILFLPVITGSVLLYDLSVCVIVVGCHQFRMHNSQNVDVYIKASSDPVIESSTQARFAPCPDDFIVKKSPDHQTPNGDFTVIDFSHIRATASPNWSMLSPETRPDMWFESVLREQEGVDLVLEKYLPTRIV